MAFVPASHGASVVAESTLRLGMSLGGIERERKIAVYPRVVLGLAQTAK